MARAWWIADSDLDEDQKAVIGLPPNGNHLIVGPPGSGKTNILLLRAKYLMRAIDKNIAIVVFTRSLNRFIASGGRDYSIPKDKITTCMKWQHDLLRQYGVFKPVSGTFMEKREQSASQLDDLVSKQGLRNLFSAILLDEAQDYTSSEMRLFKRLSKQLFAVADSRQQIFQNESKPLAAVTEVVDQVHSLRFHYRNGKNICKLADAVADDSEYYEHMLPTSRYVEDENPSQVTSHQGDLDSQCRAMASALRTQLRVFKGEFLGVVCPRKDLVNAVWERLQNETDLEPLLCRVETDSDAFNSARPICVTTAHSAKGLEVRALHFVGAEHVTGTNRRKLVFTVATRAKTSLAIYHEGDLTGWFHGAIEALKPPKPLPTLKSLFEGI